MIFLYLSGYKLTVYMGQRFMKPGHSPDSGQTHQTTRLGLCPGSEPLNPSELRTLLDLMQKFTEAGKFIIILYTYLIR